MKKILVALVLCLVMVGMLAAPVMAGNPKDSFNTIQSGLITAKNGDVITVGYDKYGYNYQSHIFNGFYGNYSRPATLVTEGDVLVMKWNDAWLSNQDSTTDADTLLDRPANYIGSGAWCTNHQSGSYELDGKIYHWTYFVKIVAAPADAYKASGVWYTADGVEIGPAIWGAFAIIEEVYNDQGSGVNGIQYNGPAPTGFGFYMPQN